MRVSKGTPRRVARTPGRCDRAYYRVEWDEAFGGLLGEELEAPSPARSAGAQDPASFIGGDPGECRES